MKIFITSFRHYWGNKKLYGSLPAFSVAVYQPNWYEQLEQADVFEIRDRDGTWIRPQLFANSANPLQAYGDELYWLYTTRMMLVNNFLKQFHNNDRLIFCCWCPYEKRTKAQINRYGSYVCHTGVIKWFIEKEFGGIKVIVDEDRRNMIKFPYKRL